MSSDETGSNDVEEQESSEVKVTDHRSVSRDETDEGMESEDEASASTETDDPKVLAARIEELNARHTDLLNRLTRTQADFANYRRRTGEDARELANYANQSFAFELLRVLDGVDRAFAAISDELRQLTWIDGVALIQAQLRGVMEAVGVKQIECRAGDPIDVELHEVVVTEGAEAEVVIDQIQSGYRMHERVIRPVLVKAGPKSEDETPSTGEAASQDEYEGVTDGSK